ncbi:hypothetical protein LY76DRAFT_599656 [Colletotrichum caudatum]|nr:hypothetical protein LY76DRAFT_599656 [Colletotrichum caudatum]
MSARQLTNQAQIVIPRHVEQARERKRSGTSDEKDTNVFAELFESDLPPKEKWSHKSLPFLHKLSIFRRARTTVRVISYPVVYFICWFSLN